MLNPSEFSEEFIEYMRNRMDVSFAKYGPLRDACPSKVNALEWSLSVVCHMMMAPIHILIMPHFPMQRGKNPG